MLIIPIQSLSRDPQQCITPLSMLCCFCSYICHSANSLSQVSILLHIYSHRASRTQYLRVDLPKLHGISPPTNSQAKKGAFATAPHSCTKLFSGRLSSVVPSAHLQASQAAIVVPLGGASKLYVTSPPALKRNTDSSHYATAPHIAICTAVLLDSSASHHISMV